MRFLHELRFWIPHSEQLPDPLPFCLFGDRASKRGDAKSGKRYNQGAGFWVPSPEVNTGPRIPERSLVVPLYKASLTSDLSLKAVITAPEVRDVLFFIGGVYTRNHPLSLVLSYRGRGPEQKGRSSHF